MNEEMIDLGVGGLKVRRDKIDTALKQLKEEGSEVRGIYAVIASRVANVHKCDLLIETSDEILIFGEELWNEPFFMAWSDEREIYEEGGAELLVKPIF